MSSEKTPPQTVKCDLCGMGGFKSKLAVEGHKYWKHPETRKNKNVTTSKAQSTKSPESDFLINSETLTRMKDLIFTDVERVVKEIIRDEMIPLVTSSMMKAQQSQSPSLLQQTLPSNPEVRTIELGSDIYIPRQVKFDPTIIEYYRYYVANAERNGHSSKDELSLDFFVNNTIDEHFSECLGVQSGIFRGSGGKLIRRK
jgi:hypothetical protein